MVFLAALAALIVFGGCFLLVRRYMARRPAAFAEAARNLGLSHQADVALSVLGSEILRLEYFQRGARAGADPRDARIEHLLSGKVEGLQVMGFQHVWTGSEFGGTRRLARQTAAVFRLSVRLPSILVGRRGGFLSADDGHSEPKVAGWHEFDFPQMKAVSKKLFVQSPTEAEGRAALRPDVLDFLEGHPYWSIETGGNTLLMYQSRTVVEPRRLEGFLREAGRFAALLSAGA